METAARYDAYASWYDARLGPLTREIAEPILQAWLGTGPGVCLDLGCGGGVHLAAVAALGWSVVGLDVSWRQLRIARERSSARAPVASDAAPMQTDASRRRGEAAAVPFDAPQQPPDATQAAADAAQTTAAASPKPAETTMPAETTRTHTPADAGQTPAETTPAATTPGHPSADAGPTPAAAGLTTPDAVPTPDVAPLPAGTTPAATTPRHPSAEAPNPPAEAAPTPTETPQTHASADAVQPTPDVVPLSTEMATPAQTTQPHTSTDAAQTSSAAAAPTADAALTTADAALTTAEAALTTAEAARRPAATAPTQTTAVLGQGSATLLEGGAVVAQAGATTPVPPRTVALVQADAARLPLADATVDAVVTAFIHSDVNDWASVLAEVGRVLRPGGRCVSIGIHPCFVGPFSRRTGDEPPRLYPGYRRTARTWRGPGLSSRGVWWRVGGQHVPLAALVNAFILAGLVVEHLAEPGPEDYPRNLAIVARRPHAPRR
jgi:SAM-dependent methyltransferase